MENFDFYILGLSFSFYESLISFLIGTIFGFFIGIALGRHVSKDGKKVSSVWKVFLAVGIILLWAYSVLHDVENGTANTPFMIHVLCSAMLAYIYPSSGEYIFQIISSWKK
jgi:hypothetical protein